MNSTISRGIVLVVLVTCSMLLLWWLVPKGEDIGGWLVTEVTSGDTIVVERDGEVHTISLAGVVAPAQDQCGFEEARDNLTVSLTDASVVVILDSRSSTGEGDWFGYVELRGVDVGLAQIDEGFARVADGGFDRRAQYEAAAKDAVPAYVCD
jgi:endonuclease YncB( thermonuclease family)